MEIVFFQTQPMDDGVDRREGFLRRLRTQIGAWAGLTGLDRVSVVVLDDGYDFLTERLGSECRVLRHTAADPVDASVGTVLVACQPCFHVPRSLVARLCRAARVQIGRKVLRAKSRLAASSVRPECTFISAELVSWLAAKQSSIQQLRYEPWDPSAMVYEETVLTDCVDDAAAYQICAATADFPSQLVLEPTNACRLACTMCPYHSDSFKEPRIGPYVPEAEFQHMAPALFKRLVDEAASRNVRCLIPQYRGEPFDHPELIELLEYAITRGMTSTAFPTNGMFISESQAQKLVDMGLPQLQFSVDALSAGLCHHIRRNADYGTVTKTLRTIKEYRDRTGRTAPALYMTFVDIDLNRHEREAYVRHYLEMVNGVRTSVGLSYEELHTQLPYQYFSCDEDWRGPCRLLLEQIVVTSDGKAVLCHTDSMRSCVIGDLNKQSIDAVFNSERVRTIRAAHAERAFEVLPICKNCQIWKADIWWPLPSFDTANVSVCGGPMWIQYTKVAARTKQAAIPEGLASRLRGKISAAVRAMHIGGRREQ